MLLYLPQAFFACMFFRPAALENFGEKMDVDDIYYYKSIRSQTSGFLDSTCSYSNSFPSPLLKEANASNHKESTGRSIQSPPKKAISIGLTNFPRLAALLLHAGISASGN